ncbi:MAG TPA: alpha/beta hydrolase [Rhizomicrobium sp.]|nr:alpha/beta hydrolase [Rhizomicrobium sp.]
MSLDPLARVFLDQLAATPRPKVWSVPPDEMRAGFRAMVKSWGPKDVPIGRVESFVMPGPGGELALRVYTPVAAGGESLPVLVFFHGGAFRVGDLDTHEVTCRILAGEGGCRVVSVDYRLSPEHKFPAAVDDALAATKWVEANAARLGIDANRIAVGGDSAGGNLAAVVCQLAMRSAGPRIAFQLLLYPVTQVGSTFPSMRTFAAGYMMEKEALEYCLGEYASGADHSDLRLSPLLAEDFSGLPAACVVLAGCDPLHDEGLAYAEKLGAAGVDVTLADYPGMLHGFTLMLSVFPQAHAALTAAAKAVRKALAKG